MVDGVRTLVVGMVALANGIIGSVSNLAALLVEDAGAGVVKFVLNVVTAALTVVGGVDVIGADEVTSVVDGAVIFNGWNSIDIDSLAGSGECGDGVLDVMAAISTGIVVSSLLPSRALTKSKAFE